MGTATTTRVVDTGTQTATVVGTDTEETAAMADTTTTDTTATLDMVDTVDMVDTEATATEVAGKETFRRPPMEKKTYPRCHK